MDKLKLGRPEFHELRRLNENIEMLTEELERHNDLQESEEHWMDVLVEDAVTEAEYLMEEGEVENPFDAIEIAVDDVVDDREMLTTVPGWVPRNFVFEMVSKLTKVRIIEA